MPVITQKHTKLYQGKPQPANKLVIFGHGIIKETDQATFKATIPVKFYVQHENMCLIVDGGLRQAIQKGKEPFYTEAVNNKIHDYYISKYRGLAGKEESNHMPDNRYLALSRDQDVDILRVRHRFNHKKMRLSELVAYAVASGYAEVYCLHCRYVDKQFPTQKRKRVHDEQHTQSPQFLA